LLIWSEEFENSTWVKSVANITYNQPDPFGGNEAILCTFNNDGLSRIAQLRAITAGTTYTLSAWIKGVNITQFRFLLGTNQVVFVTSQIINGEWVRVTATVTATTSGNFQQSPARSNNDNGESFYIYGAQLETGTVATTYIPTTSTIASRVPAWNDLSRSGNNGTLINGPTYSSANGGSIVFDGVDDYINIPQFVSTSQNMSFSLWFNPVSLQAGVAVNTIFLQSENASTNTIRLYRNTNFSENRLAWLVYYESISTSRVSILPQYTYPLNTWTNTVLTFNSTGEYRTYINGTLFNTTQAVDFIRWYTPQGFLRIGGLPSGPLNGNVSSLGIWEKSLSAQEILQNYSATKTRFGL
jgi:hypothetical protein